MMASVKWREDRGHWEVLWREPKVIQNPDGSTKKKWSTRRRKAPSKKAADALAREIETAAAVGDRWEDKRMTAVSTIGSAVEGYIIASKRRPKATQKYRASVLQKFMDHVGEDTTLDRLDVELLRDYADHLDAQGIKSVSRYIGTVEQWWTWAWNNRKTYPGVQEPTRLTGKDAEIQHRPAPAAVDTPTWEDIDAVLLALSPEGTIPGRGAGYGYRPQWEVYRRIVLVQRYTGLRISQVVGLRWQDLDLERGWLTIRSNKKGAKGQSRDRVVPLHPGLVSILETWSRDEDLLFFRVATKGKRKGQVIQIKGSEVAEVLGGNDKVDHRTKKRTHTAGAWERAGIDPEKWADAGDRTNKRGTNAIRARWKSTIAGAASYELATLMVGQSTAGDHDSYVAMGNPEASPYWNKMVQALEAIPEVEVSRQET